MSAYLTWNEIAKLPLPELAFRIKNRCDQLYRKEQANLSSAKELGDLLRSAKKKCKLKEKSWEEWYKANLDIKQQRVSEYICISRHWEEVCGCESIREAIEVIRSIKPPAPVVTQIPENIEKEPKEEPQEEEKLNPPKKKNPLSHKEIKERFLLFLRGVGKGVDPEWLANTISEFLLKWKEERGDE